MNFGIHLNIYESKELLNIVRRIERSKIRSVFFHDSLLSYDPLSVLNFLSSSTKRVMLGTSVYILPLRNPLHVANQLSFLQKYSSNRVIFGVGVGWRKNEFSLLGVDYKKRGEIANEQLKIIIDALTTGEVNHRGKHYSLSVRLNTKVEKLPEIWIGGNSKAAMIRAINYGDVWFPTDLTVDEQRKMKQMLEKLNKSGRKIAVALHLLTFVSGKQIEAERTAKSFADRIGEDYEKMKEYSIIGGEEEAINKIKEYEAAGASEIVFSLHMLSYKQALRSVEILSSVASSYS